MAVVDRGFGSARACLNAGERSLCEALWKKLGPKEFDRCAPETLDDGVTAAQRLLKRSRYTVEDGLEEAAHNIKQHPFSSLAIGFAAGAALGLLVPRFGKK
jgi:hypothetical protein